MIFQGNFSILSIDDLSVNLKLAVPKLKFVIAMNESVPKITRVNGNDEEMKKLASENILKIGAGHAGIIFLREAFSVNVLKVVKNHPCVCQVYAASSNPMQIIIIEASLGKPILGVVDGTSSKEIENKEQEKERKQLVKKLEYG
ncbi:MAG: adenosine-specific kinase [Candidatus Ranarchaeia archaeon]